MICFLVCVFHLILSLKFFLVLLFETSYSVSKFHLTICVCFYELDEMDTSPNFEGVAFYRNIPWLDCG